MKKTKRPLRDKDGLLLREALFCRQYLICKGNVDQAAREAGYVSENAGTRLMEREDVRRVIDRERARVFDRLDISVDRVLNEVARIAFFDPRRCFRLDENGVSVMIPLCELDDDTAAVISGVGVRPNGRTTRIRFANKLQALGMLGQHLRLWDGAGNGMVDRLSEVIAAFQEGPVKKEPSIQ